MFFPKKKTENRLNGLIQRRDQLEHIQQEYDKEYSRIDSLEELLKKTTGKDSCMFLHIAVMSRNIKIETIFTFDSSANPQHFPIAVDVSLSTNPKDPPRLDIIKYLLSELEQKFGEDGVKQALTTSCEFADSVLDLAAMAGSSEIVAYLIETYGHLELTYTDETLHHALQNFPESALLLQKSACEMQQRKGFLSSVVETAIAYNLVDWLKLFLEKNPNKAITPDYIKVTPLEYAVYHSRSSIVSYLQSAFPTTQFPIQAAIDVFANRPLTKAVKPTIPLHKSRLAVLLLLLKQVRSQDANAKYQLALKMTTNLIESIPDPDIKQELNHILSTLSQQQTFPSENAIIAEAQLLLGENTNPIIGKLTEDIAFLNEFCDVIAKEGDLQPFIEQIKQHNLATVCLNIAIQYASVSSVKTLIKLYKEANINYSDLPDYDTIVKLQHIIFLPLLCVSPLTFAITKLFNPNISYRAIAMHLVDEFDANALSYDAFFSMLFSGKLAADCFAEINTRTLSPLHLAVIMGEMDIVNSLLKHGAKADAILESVQMTPLLLTCRYGRQQQFKVIDLLIDKHKVDVNQTIGNNTAVQCAVQSGVALILKHLVEEKNASLPEFDGPIIVIDPNEEAEKKEEDKEKAAASGSAKTKKRKKKKKAKKKIEESKEESIELNHVSEAAALAEPKEELHVEINAIEKKKDDKSSVSPQLVKEEKAAVEKGCKDEKKQQDVKLSQSPRAMFWEEKSKEKEEKETDNKTEKPKSNAPSNTKWDPKAPWANGRNHPLITRSQPKNCAKGGGRVTPSPK